MKRLALIGLLLSLGIGLMAPAAVSDPPPDPTIKPVFDNLPTDITHELGPGEATGASIGYGTVTAHDDVGPVAASCGPDTPVSVNIGSPVTVNCSATNAVGTTNGSFKITVTDTSFPDVGGMPGDQTVEATSSSGAAVSFTPPTSWTDTNEGSVPVNCAPGPGTFPFGTTQVTCSATDANGNKSQASFSVTVEDTTKPVVTAPSAPPTAEATSGAGAAVSYGSASATDTVDGTDPVNCAPASGSTFAIGTTTVTCSATDAHNNTGTATFSVKVQDTTPPTINGTPGNITIEGNTSGGASVSWTGPTASDIVDGTDAVNCSPGPGVFAVGTTGVTCSSSDANGNQATQTHFNVTVNDTTPPQITGATDLSAEATGPGGAAVGFSLSASDIVDGSRSVNCTPSSGSTFPVGTTGVNCSASDTHGNTANASFNVTVKDTTPPQFSGVPGNEDLEAGSSAGATLTYAKPTATDLVSGSVAVNCSPAPGAVAPLGQSTVTCTATDAHGNTASVSFSVLVMDTTPPTAVSPGDFVAAATGPNGAIVNYPVPSGSDAVGPVFTKCTPPPGTLFPLGKTLVTCAISDGSGNSVNVTFNVIVVTKETILQGLPSNQTAEATGPDGAAVTFKPPAGATCKPASGSTFPVGVTNVTCESGDQAGTFTITVKDTTPPAFTGGAKLFVKDVNAAASAQVEYPVPTATDKVDGKVQVVCKPQPGSEFKLGTSKATCTARDKHGNVGTDTISIEVRDVTKPPPVVALQVHLHGSSATVEWELPPGNDAVATVLVRKPGTTTGLVVGKPVPKPTVLYRGPRTTFVDHGLKKGVHYEYDAYAVDRASNQSGKSAALAAIPLGPLTAPFDGERFTSPPLLTWKPNGEADYYNVQLWLVNGKSLKKELSIWPTTAHLQLQREWDYRGSHFLLAPGVYRWYVWPGFGPLAKAKYGKLIGSATFVVLGPAT
jgi:hypothetical protein